MDAEKLEKILQEHEVWVRSNHTRGKRARLVKGGLIGADLQEVNLCGAYLYGANFRQANLRKANLREANLTHANLRGANLSGADLRGANLLWADLRGTSLCGADLSGAYLVYADLLCAHLKGANLQDVDLDFSCFPVCYDGLDVHIDDRLVRQILYHLLHNVAYSRHTSEEMKGLLLTPELVNAANQFHHIEECEKISSLEVMK